MKTKNRFLEIDLIRGFFIFCVCIFHFLWDLNFFFNLEINLYSPIGSFLQKLGAGTFFILVGISSVIQRNIKGDKYSFKVPLIRGGKILLLAFIISLVVYFTYPQNNIVFGVLHCIGVSSILVFPFLNKRYLPLILGLIIIFSSFYTEKILLTTNKFLIPFGIRYYGFRSVDYFPLIPWLGVALLGVFLGNVLYKKEKPNEFLFSLNKFLEKKKKNFFFRIFLISGQKSSYIYTLHQPALYLICYLIFKSMRYFG